MIKSVFAHFMVGNTYPYTEDDWIEDICLASDNDLDGFALNVGCESWQRDRVADCFSALAKARRTFRVFLSFDMHSIPGGKTGDAQVLVEYMEAFGHHPNMFRYNGSVVVSTFSGEQHKFGQKSCDDGWCLVKRSLEKIVPIHFIPSFFLDPAMYPRMRCMNGAFNWNGGWPLQLTADSPRSKIEFPRLDSDNHHLRHLNARSFMAAVSPWFFTHYGPETWNKNWIYRGDDWLFARRWEQLITMRDYIDIIQVISWNDYGESHYIGPIKGAQPNSQAWVDGYPHIAWLKLNAYFTRAFKYGAYPPVEGNQIFLWARPHPKAALATNDNVDRPTHWQVTDDTLWVIVFATEPAIVTLQRAYKFKIQPGVTKLSSPLHVDTGIDVKMTREVDSSVLAECSPSDFRFTHQPETYNFNAFVAMS